MVDTGVVYKVNDVEPVKPSLTGTGLRQIARQRALLITVVLAVVVFPLLCQMAFGDPLLTASAGVITAALAAALLMIGAGASVTRDHSRYFERTFGQPSL